MKLRETHPLIPKLGFTALILAFYLLGRAVPLFSIDRFWYNQSESGAEYFLGMAVGGDAYKISIMALGISPYMISSILIMAIYAIRRASTHSKISMDKMDRALYIITFIITVVQAVFMVSEMHFLPCGISLWAVKSIAALEMIAGAMFIVWLIVLNRDRGIGGQAVMIVVNLLGSITTMLSGLDFETLKIPLLCSLAAVLVTLIMENAEFRIPVQRIFIHSVYRDKNYIAIKYNPIGVLPVMFSTAIFVFIQQLFMLIEYLLPSRQFISAAVDALTLTQPLGIGLYLAIVYLFTVVFSLILVGPSDMTEQFLKNNDSLCNICAGKPTKRYLTRVILLISLLSATVMSLCVGAALVLQVKGSVDAGLVMLPSIAMMLTSILVSLFRELKTAVCFESYRVFL